MSPVPFFFNFNSKLGFLNLYSFPGKHPGDIDNGKFGHLGPRKVKHYPILIDNPEYQLGNPEYTNVPLAFAPLGLPQYRPDALHAPSLSHISNSSTATTTSNNNNAQMRYDLQNPYRPCSSSRRHGSRSEEESDHEYYNELDRLKREKQPLHQRKSETTV